MNLKISLLIFKQVPEFWEDFKKYSSMVNIRSALTYYNRDMCLTGNRNVVHCTAKFCGYEKSTFRVNPFCYYVLHNILKKLRLVFNTNLIIKLRIMIFPSLFAVFPTY
jgi:hypothetical protein